MPKRYQGAKIKRWPPWYTRTEAGIPASVLPCLSGGMGWSRCSSWQLATSVYPALA